MLTEFIKTAHSAEHLHKTYEILGKIFIRSYALTEMTSLLQRGQLIALKTLKVP
jgi:propanediol utilization protein